MESSTIGSPKIIYNKAAKPNESWRFLGAKTESIRLSLLYLQIVDDIYMHSGRLLQGCLSA